MNKNLGNILLADDEESLRETLKLNLTLEGYTVTAVTNGNDALKAIKNEYFDLVILDVMMPGLDGIAVCETIRLHRNNVPIIILSAKSLNKNKVEGLKKGADDYVIKPYNLEEILLRIEKLIAKNKQIINTATPQQSVYTFKSGSIDFAGHCCTDRYGVQHELSKKESLLLKLLTDHEGEVVTREQILVLVWGHQVYPALRTIDNFILVFRKYFEADSRRPEHFFSIRGVGYKFCK